MRLIRNIRGWIESHNYCFILLYFFFYMTVFTLEEQYLRPVVIVRCPLDDLIPFNSLFIIPYFAWFLLVPAVIGYFMFTSKEEFLDLCFMLFTGMTICLAIYAVVPNGIHLREMITGHDICSQLVIMLRQVDTATNVCPSIHVFATLGVLLSVMRSPRFTGKRLLKGFLIILSVLICLATVFLKQHSVIDLFCGTALAVIMYHWSYHCNWRRGADKTPICALL